MYAVVGLGHTRPTLQAFNTIDDFHLLQWADVTKPLEGAISFGNCRLWECPG